MYCFTKERYVYREVRDIPHMAHGVRVAGNFTFSKMLSALDGYPSKNKTWDIKLYCRGCLICQQQNDAAGRS